MRVLLDTNVVLDVILAREPFGIVSRELFSLHDAGVFEACISAITPVQVFYFVKKFRDVAAARDSVRRLLQSFTVCPVTADVLRGAQQLTISDYEDAVQHASAAVVAADAIVTRDVTDFKNASLRVFTPDAFLQHLKSNQQDQTGI